MAQPIFKGAFHRDDSTFSITGDDPWYQSHSEGTMYRDLQIKWVQELSRTIDYLETREDINTDKLGFYGVSWGGSGRAYRPCSGRTPRRYGPTCWRIG